MPDHNASYLYDDSDLQRLFAAIIKRHGNAEAAFELIGEIVNTSIMRNFEDGGRPRKWKDLADSTKKQRARQGNWPGQILVRSGTRSGLMGSISYDARPKEVVFVANKPYAAIQNFGGQAGRKRATEIPAREYMMIQDEDWPVILETLNDFLIKG